MMLLSKLRSLFFGLRRRSQVESGMTDEVSFHIEARAEDLMKTGASHEEAWRQARLEFGSLEKYKEEIREARGLQLFDEIRADVKYAARLLRNSPAFSLAAILMLALGIAANGSVFSIVNEVFFKKLPVKNPNDLVQLDWLRVQNSMFAGYAGDMRRDPASGLLIATSFSYKTFENFRDHNKTLSTVFAFNPIVEPLNVVVDNDAQIANGQFVSGNYFVALGVSAVIGRPILPSDDNTNAQPVAVISDRYWKGRFGGSPNIVGKRISINGASVEVIGVTPPEFFGTKLGKAPDVSVPFAMRLQIAAERNWGKDWQWWVEVMGRLRAGVTREQVLADLRPLFEDGVRETWDMRPARYRTLSFEATRTVVPPLRVNDGSRGPVAMRRRVVPMLAALVGVVGVILLIVCANLANLLLARASSRQQEIAVRLAIGAGRRRLIRQLMTESMLLALCGGLLGVFFAYWGKDLLSWLPQTAEDLLAIHPGIDWRVVVFTAGVSLITGLLFGVFPCLRATKADLSPSMRADSNRGGIPRLLVSKSLLSVQVALCLVLLVGGGLIVRSVRNLLNAEIGFNAHNVVLFSVEPQLNNYNKVRAYQLYERLIENIEAVPGVQSATISGTRPITGGGWSMWVTASDDPNSRARTYVFVHNVRANFLQTMQIPLFRGRGLSSDEERNGASVAILNQTMAAQLFKDADPIGKRFRYAEAGEQNHTAFEVIGVVRDARYHTIDRENPATMYIPFSQGPSSGTFEVRTTADPAAAMPAIREAVRNIDPNLPLIDMRTQEDQIRDSIGTYRMFATFTTVFGLFAVLLACVGLYGVVSYTVTRRTHEIGIRMALGAKRSEIVHVVMRGIYVVTIVGTAVGLAVALVVTHSISSWLLYGVSSYDPLTIFLAFVIIIFVSMLAGYLPARRAARLDPMTALRYE